MSQSAAITCAILAILPLAGCSHLARDSQKSYTTVVTDSSRDPQAAREACDRAAKHFQKGNLAKAEAALQDALIADVSYAPAHNNLGRVYFDEGKLYLAAWEFEYARRLLPESADVVNNLGMVYEAAGQMDRAIENYSLALSMDQGNPVYMANLAKSLVREDKDPTQAALLLRDLILNDSRPEWVAWARDQLNLREPLRTAAHSTEVHEQPAEVLPNAEALPVPKHIDDLTPMLTPPEKQ